jgi:hypothetical protein
MSHKTRSRRHRNTLDRGRDDPRLEDRRQSGAGGASRIVIGYARCSTDRQDPHRATPCSTPARLSDESRAPRSALPARRFARCGREWSSGSSEQLVVIGQVRCGALMHFQARGRPNSPRWIAWLTALRGRSSDCRQERSEKPRPHGGLAAAVVPDSAVRGSRLSGPRMPDLAQGHWWATGSEKIAGRGCHHLRVLRSRR